MTLHIRIVRLLLLGVVLFSACRTSPKASTGSRSKETSVKPGINDHYVNADVNEWVGRFEVESREIYRHRHRIMEALALPSGATVADIGAGTGLFVPLLSEAVGAEGQVLAVDITPEFLDHIRNRSRQERLKNVQTIQCRDDDVSIANDSVDVAFICDVYHHFEYPQDSMQSLYKAMRAGGIVYVIDFDRIPEQSREWILGHVRLGKEKVIREIQSTGFMLDRELDSSYLEENYFLRFRKPN